MRIWCRYCDGLVAIALSIHTSRRLSGTPTAPLLIWALKGVNPASPPISRTHSCSSVPVWHSNDDVARTQQCAMWNLVCIAQKAREWRTCSSATASSLTPYFMSISQRALMFCAHVAAIRTDARLLFDIADAVQSLTAPRPLQEPGRMVHLCGMVKTDEHRGGALAESGLTEIDCES